MPKRSNNDESDYNYLRKKIKKLEKKLKKQESDRDSRSRSRNYRTPPSRSPSPPTTPPPPSTTPPPAPLTMPPPPAPPTRPARSQSTQPQPLEAQPKQPQASDQQLSEATLATPQPPPPPPTPVPTTEKNEERLSEEFLDALGHEGEEQMETGEPITSELALRWTKIMAEGLTKEQKESLLGKYHIPENFKTAIAPILNKEIAATLSELSINRDKRIITRQNMTGKLMCCLGKSLTEVLKGNINSKKLIEEINDAAKIASELYHNDSKSRKFFALSSASKAVQEACKDAKTDKYLFGEGLSEQIKAIQSVKRTAAQIKGPENKASATTAKPLNWRGPPQYHQTSQRGRGGQRPVRRPPVNQPPRRPAPPRNTPRHASRKTHQRRY